MLRFDRSVLTMDDQSQDVQISIERDGKENTMCTVPQETRLVKRSNGHENRTKKLHFHRTTNSFVFRQRRGCRLLMCAMKMSSAIYIIVMVL